jgi:hypothetical protein
MRSFVCTINTGSPKTSFRLWSGITVLAFAAIALPACASSPDEKMIDQQTITALAARIPTAQPREQAFLYAELIHQMTEFSMKQYAAGDTDKATDLLKEIQTVTKKLHLSMGDNNKRLKNAEILLRHTAFRLTQFLHNSNSDDRDVVEATLAQVNKAESETMLEVFHK